MSNGARAEGLGGQRARRRGAQPSYWNNGKTVIEKVTYLPIQSTNAELNRYLAGEVDLTYNMPIERFKQMKKDLPDEVKVSGYVGYYQYNFKHKPFDDVRVRTALSYAIDRNVIADKVMGKGETRATRSCLIL